MVPYVFTIDSFTGEIRRLSDLDYRVLCHRSVSISEDGMFFLTCAFFPPFGGTVKRLNLAELRFVLEHFCGSSGVLYDEYKGSFSFPPFTHAQEGR